MHPRCEGSGETQAGLSPVKFLQDLEQPVHSHAIFFPSKDFFTVSKKEREKMEEVGGLCEIQRKKSRGEGGTKRPKARERAPGREDDTGIFYHFFPL